MRGRIRTVKPEAFKDEELWDLEQLTELPLFRAYQGLWCYADREGRFEWRPRALKSDILPYWNGDFEAVLEALVAGKFIVRYTVDGKHYGYVPTLSKHQRFDHREPPSELPAPPEPETAPPGHAQELPGHAQEAPGHARVEGKGREGNGKGEGTEARARKAPPGAPNQTDPDEPDREPGYTQVPDDWVVSEALYAEAELAGVPPDVLDEDVTYWRERKSLNGEFRTIEGFFRTHFPRLAKRRETQRFKRQRAGPDDVLQAQADRILKLRELEAREERGA